MNNRRNSAIRAHRYYVKVQQIGLFFTLLFFCFCSVFTFAANASKVNFLDKVNQSKRDNRQYKVIVLPNKMRVLLVSDLKAVKSLGSLALPIGSLQDPSNQQGLAHYTEHMVLMGSKSYPNPADFALFLNRHAGSYNASTAAYRTSFYFEVENGALEPALDRLASAIADPILDPKFADKERNAVNAELTMARANDGFRIQQVDAETINQQHPASQFSGGNLQTLSDKPISDKSVSDKKGDNLNSKLQQALMNFHANYYSANLMVGVVYSNQPIDQLAKLAEKTFGKIQNHHISAPQLDKDALTKDTLSKQITMIPAQRKKLLYLQFAIDNNIAQFAEKSDEYIAYMISNRSQNTLFDQLQKKGLIENIQANGDPNRYGNSGVFSITVSLTDAGLTQKESVIAAIFNYLKLIQRKGVQSDYYQELKKVLALDFAYQSTDRDMSYVEWLSDQMLLYPISNILDSSYIATNFNKQAINDRLQKLTVDNARIWTIAPDQTTNKMAYFVDAPYKIENISAEQKARWFELEKQFTFHLPELNPYIADDFSIVKQSKETIPVVFSPKGNHIHFASRYFVNEPKAAIALSLRDNQALNDVKSQVEFNLLDYIVGRNLAQLQFQASVAGISLSTSTDSGLLLSATGFSQHLPDMIMAVFDRYQTVTIDDANLLLAKAWYHQQLDAADSQNSYKLAMQPFQALNSIPYFDRHLKRKIIDDITVSDLHTYRNRLLSNAVPYMLSIGNISEQESLTVYQKIEAALKKNPGYQQQAHFLPKNKIKIKQSTTALITQQAANTDNALLMSYWPTSYDEISARVLSYTLYKIISPWFYDQLRSNEQLGYAVFALPAYLGESAGIGFLIQSNQYDPNYLLKRYQQFYPVMLEKLQQLSSDDINQYKQAVINELMLPAQTLDEEFQHYMTEYQLSEFNFDSRQKKIARAKTITQKELVDFYQKAVIKQKGLVFASQVLGKAEVAKMADKNQQPQSVSSNYIKYDNAAQLQKALLLESSKNNG